MNHNYLLLNILVMPIVFAMNAQVPVNQKIQQLKDAWYQKANELAKLGTKLIERNKVVLDLQDTARSLAKEIASNHSEEDLDVMVDALLASTKNLYDKLFQAVRDKVNVRGFFMKELYENKGDYLKNKAHARGLLDSIKLIMLQIIIEADLTQKLLEDYEDCLQKMAEIEHELVLLGQPRLYK
jgi:hypothetical protein